MIYIIGVCFYGKTAESVLSILATGNYRTVTPSGLYYIFIILMCNNRVWTKVADLKSYIIQTLCLPFTVRRPKDCSDLDPKLDTSGVYTIYPTIGRGFKAYCDMKTDGGRWTVS